MESYFGKKNTGGSNASKGFRYQDYCSLYYLFKYCLLDDELFLEIGLETTNDFEIILKNNQIISVQVKENQLNLTTMKKLVKSINLNDNNIIKNIFIATSFSEDLRKLNDKLKNLKDVKKSKKSKNEKLKVENDFIEVLKKHKCKELYEKLLITEFKEIPESNLDLSLLALCYELLSKLNINSDNAKNVLNELELEIVNMRCDRKFIKKEEIYTIINKYKDKFYIDKTYSSKLEKILESYINEPSDILKNLGQNNKDILSGLEKKIIEANKFEKEEKYKDALKIYSSLGNIYEKDNLFVKCCVLCILDKNYNEAIEYANLSIEKNKNNYDAYFLLGDLYFKLRDNVKDNLNLSLKNYKKANRIKETAELYNNIGKIYYIKNENEKALKNYKKALNLNSNLAEVHLNISYVILQYPDKLYHLNKAIELNPTLYQAYSEKGELLRFIGLPELALKYFKKCLINDKFNEESLRGMFFSLFELGRFDESTIYLTDWLKTYKKDIFKSNSEQIIITIDYFKTHFVSLKKIDENRIMVCMPDKDRVINITEEKEIIFIGTIGKVAVVGKSFDKKYNYDENKKIIHENEKLLKVEENYLIDLKNSIEVYVTIFNENTYVEICSKNYKVIGYTEQNGEGLKSFLKIFNENKKLYIIFSCKEYEEELIIDNITNVKIKQGNDMKLENFTEDISKEEFIHQMKNDSYKNN